VKASTRSRLLIGAAVLLVLALAIALMAGRPAQARGSVLSRAPSGWLAARRYLAARGARVSLLDRPLSHVEGAGALVTAFPWQLGPTPEAGEQLEEHLRRGGDVVLAYSGELNAAELVALTGLGLPPEEKRKAVLNPFAWRRFARQEWELRPVAGLSAAPVRVWAPRWMPEIPKSARVLYRSPKGDAAIAVLERLRGRIWILPADALANARLENPGNGDLLETLFRQLGSRWTFDEYHHGLIAHQGTETVAFGRALDLVLVHLALLYLAALLTLARRFGPAWNEPPVVTGSAGSFLLGLGAIHHRLGHHREAARRLLERARELDRNLDLFSDLEGRAETAGPRELVALAREVARRRASGPAGEPVTQRENAA
jgi:hypothetical protein